MRARVSTTDPVSAPDPACSGDARLLSPLLDDVRAALEWEEWEEARALLARLRGLLETHFSLEDRVYFPALCALLPTVEEDLHRLSREHGSLLAAIDGIVDRLTQGRGEDLATCFDLFVADFGDHEARESAILLSIEQQG